MVKRRRHKRGIMGLQGSIFKVTYGKCPRCGAAASDDTSPGSAYSSSNLISGTGVELVWFRGKPMCYRCKDQILSEEESRKSARKIAASNRYRNKLGYRNSL